LPQIPRGNRQSAQELKKKKGGQERKEGKAEKIGADDLSNDFVVSMSPVTVLSS